MEKKKACLISLFKRLTSTFRKESHEHLMSLQGALELCHLLIMTDAMSTSRTMTVSVSELANYLGWKPGGFEMQYSKYSQEKKEVAKKEEKEKEKEKEKPIKEEVQEEPVTAKVKEEEVTEKVDEGEALPEKTETAEEKKEDEIQKEEVKKEEVKKEEVRKEEVKKEEVKKEEPRREDETQERIHPLRLLEKQVIVS